MAGDNLTWKTQKKDPFTSFDKIKENLPQWAELQLLRNGALLGHFRNLKMYFIVSTRSSTYIPEYCILNTDMGGSGEGVTLYIEDMTVYLLTIGELRFLIMMDEVVWSRYRTGHKAQTQHSSNK